MNQQLAVKRTKHSWSYQSLAVGLLVLALTSMVKAQPAQYGEAPQLAALVAAGQLPSIEERLPTNPMVVPVIERIGDYGGTWRMASIGGADTAFMTRTMGYDYLVRWTPDGSEIIPNIAHSWDINEDSTEFTFHLREGMKWSDGQPFTTDDIIFWYEDVALNDELSPAGPPSWLTVEGEPVVVEKVDDYTVRFVFTAPQGFFLQQLATPSGDIFTNYPRHYLEQFHATYNPDGIDALVSEAGLDDWTQLFTNEASWIENSRRPTLFAWVMTTAYGEGTVRVAAERNPYYWKVDEEGNQLPYIDSLRYDLLESADVALLRALAGEIDMQSRRITSLENLPVFVDNMERGDYRFYQEIDANMNEYILALNLVSNDPVKREVFQNKDFRIGLSHAIDRQEIIDLVFIGQGEPWQAAPRPEDPFYDEELAKQYTEFNPDLANEYLDRVLPERDAQGWRLGPDGNRFTFTLELSTHNQARVDVTEVLQMHIRDVGLDMQVRPMDRSLWATRVAANEHDATMWTGAGGMNIWLDPRWYFPYSMESYFAVPWAEWYVTGESEGEEPLAAPRRQMELYNQLTATADPERQRELGREILEIAKEEFYAIGITLPARGFGIVKNDFRNVPEAIPDAFMFATPGLTSPEQYFIESGN